MKSYAVQLLEIKPDTNNRAIACLIASAMLEADIRPFRFSINHDVRPPKCLYCPLRYDWQRKDVIGIQTNDAQVARRWIIRAVLLGYKVTRESETRSLTSSLEIARARARIYQRPPNDDEDIPF